MTYKSAILALVTLLLPVSGFCQTETVQWVNDTASGALLKNTDQSTLLTAGGAGAGNGAVLQLGYFNQATTGNNFSGTFVPLTGMGGVNSFFATTSVGDGTASSAVNGRFNLASTFIVGDSTRGNSLPAPNTPLTILFYNNTTIASSTAYGAVSSDSWLWVPPNNSGTAIVDIFLEAGGAAAGFKLLNNSTNIYYTNIPVPEPSTWVFLGIGVVGVILAIGRNRILKA